MNVIKRMDVRRRSYVRSWSLKQICTIGQLWDPTFLFVGEAVQEFFGQQYGLFPVRKGVIWADCVGRVASENRVHDLSC